MKNYKMLGLLSFCILGSLSFSTPLKYGKLESISKSIKEVGEDNKLSNDVSSLAILDEIYANNPYSYTLNTTRESLRFFEDNLTYLTINPKKYDLMLQFKVAYPNIKQDNEASGKGYYGKDIGERKYTSKAATVGGLLTLEYGLTNETSLGITIGGNNQNISFTGDSEATANSGYIGGFGRTKFGNLKLMLGGGYQYTSAKADRILSQVNNGADYSLNSYNGFAEAKYSIPVGKIFRAEPKIRASYYGVNQDAISETYQNSGISIGLDEEKLNTLSVTSGVDLVFENVSDSGKISNVLSLEGVFVSGDTDKNLQGYIVGNQKNSSLFEIQGPQINDVTGRVAYNLEIEQFGGMIYNFKTSIEIGDNGYTNYNFLVGAGYKFATYTEIIPKKEILPEPEPIVEIEPEPEPEPIPVVEVKRYILNLQFATDKFALTAKDKKQLEDVAKEINERNNNITVKVVGHTDSTGSDKYNLRLSERRAETAKKYLESLLNLERDGYKATIESYGVGEAEPIATNKTREGRAKNRRVEIKIFE